MAQGYDVRQEPEGLQWNVFALLAGFEWLSASFALHYLDAWLAPEWIHYSCLGWNVAGVLLFMPYAMPMTLLQSESGLTGLSLVGAGIMQAGEVQTGLAVRKGREESYAEEDILFHASTDPGEFDMLTGGGRTWQVPKKTEAGPISPTQMRITLHYSEYCRRVAWVARIPACSVCVCAQSK